MSDRNTVAASPERLARVHKILDAAAALILRWGYNKTTVEDIAREAGVGKGTVYLHWKTREALFKTLIRREQVALAEDFQQRIAADPEGARLGVILKHTMIATLKRPLLKALTLRDMDVWGKMLEGEYTDTAFIEKMVGFNAYLEFLRERDLVRTDLSVEAQVAMVVAIVMGFFVAGPMLPEKYRHSDEELAALLSETVRSTFEPRGTISPDQLQEATASFQEYTAHIAGLLQKQFQQEIAS